MTKIPKKFRQLVIPTGAPLNDVVARLGEFQTGDAFVIHLRTSCDYMPALEAVRYGGASCYLSRAEVPVVGVTLLKGDLKTFSEFCSVFRLRRNADSKPYAGCAFESTMQEMRRTLLSIETECVGKVHITFHFSTLKLRVFEDGAGRRYLDFSL